MTRSLLLAGFAGLITTFQITFAAPGRDVHRLGYCPVIYHELPENCRSLPETFLAFSTKGFKSPTANPEILDDAVKALAVLQDHYFEPDYATWPSTVDWTAAVAGTVVAGMLTTLSKSLGLVQLGDFDDWKARENLISSFYAQLVGSYYGQDVLSLRGQV